MSRHSYIYDEPEERPLLPEGDYDFMISEVFAFETSKTTGNEFMPIKIRIRGGGELYDNLVFTSKAKFRVDQLLKSIGRAPAPGTPVDFDDPSWLIGCKGRVRLKIDEYQGKKNNKVDAYLFTAGAIEGRRVTAATPAPLAPPRRAAPAGAATGGGFDDADDSNIPF